MYAKRLEPETSSARPTFADQSCFDAARADTRDALGPACRKARGSDVLGVALKYLLVRLVEREIGPVPMLRRRLQAGDPEQRAVGRREVTAALLRAAKKVDPRLLERLATHAGCGLPDARLGLEYGQPASPTRHSWLWRVIQLAFEHLLAEPVAPELLLASAPLSARAFRGSFTHAVVFGEFVGFLNEFFPLVLDARSHEASECSASQLNVVAVHKDWLTASGQALRAIFYDRATETFIEAPVEEPLHLDSVHFLYLGAAGEQQLHETLSRRLADRVQVNPVQGARIADRKSETYRLLCSALVPSPKTVLIPADSTPQTIAYRLARLCREGSSDGFVIQPDCGTEGEGVSAFGSSVDGRPDPAAVRAVQQLAASGDVVARERIAGRCYRESGTAYRADLRVNVAWDGRRYRAESGYLQVAGDVDAVASSVGRGGRIVKLSDGALEGLAITRADRDRALETACAAALALASGSNGAPLGLVGVDLKLESRSDGIRPCVLDANPRPAGLSHSDFFDTLEPGVALGLWSGLLAATARRGIRPSPQDVNRLRGGA